VKRAPAHAQTASGLAATLLGFGLGLVLAFSSPAGATEDNCSDPGHAGVPECATTTTVDPTTTTVDPGTSTTLGRTQPAAPSRPTSSGGLAFTGSDVTGLAVIGAGVAGAGVALTAISRRRSHRDAAADPTT
jgi:hypothetical protein